MSSPVNSTRRAALRIGVRALLMLLTGLYAVIWPAHALTAIVFVGGIVLVVDSLLTLWSLLFGGEKGAYRGFELVSGVISLVLGVLMVLSPLLITVFTITFLATLLGLSAVIGGVAQIFVAFTGREKDIPVLPTALSGICYVLLGLVFLLFPLLTASLGIVLVGLVLVACSIGLFGWAFRLYRSIRAESTFG